MRYLDEPGYDDDPHFGCSEPRFKTLSEDGTARVFMRGLMFALLISFSLAASAL